MWAARMAGLADTKVALRESRALLLHRLELRNAQAGLHEHADHVAELDGEALPPPTRILPPRQAPLEEQR